MPRLLVPTLLLLLVVCCSCSFDSVLAQTTNTTTKLMNGTTTTTTSTTTTTMPPTPAPTAAPTAAPTPAPPTPAPSDEFTAMHLLWWCGNLTLASFTPHKCRASTVCANLNGKCYPSCFRANHSQVCHRWPNCVPLNPGPGCAPRCLEPSIVWPTQCDSTPGCSAPFGFQCRGYVAEEMPIRGVQAAASIWHMCEQFPQDKCRMFPDACVRFNGMCVPSCSAANHSGMCASWIHCRALSTVPGQYQPGGRCRLKCEDMGITGSKWCEWAAVGGGCTLFDKKCVSMVNGPVESCAAWGNDASLPRPFPNSGCASYKGMSRPVCDYQFTYGVQDSDFREGFGACTMWGHCEFAYQSPITDRVICRPICTTLNATECHITSDCLWFNSKCMTACHFFNTSETCAAGNPHCWWNADAKDVWRDGIVGVVNQCQAKCLLAQNYFACEHILGGSSSRGPLFSDCVWVPNRTVLKADGKTYETIPSSCDDRCSTLGTRGSCEQKWHCQWLSTGCKQRCEHAISEAQCTEATGFRDACMYVRGQCMPHCLMHGSNGTACSLSYRGVCTPTIVSKTGTYGGEVSICNIKRCDFMNPSQCQRGPPGGSPAYTSCMWYLEGCHYTCDAALRMSDQERLCVDVEQAKVKLCNKEIDPLDTTKKLCTPAACSRASISDSMCKDRSQCSWVSGLDGGRGACNETCSSIPPERCNADYAQGCDIVPTSYFTSPSTGAVPREQVGCAPACHLATSETSCRTMRDVVVNTGAPPGFAPQACFWDETSRKCLRSCFRYLDRTACNTVAATHCWWNEAPIDRLGNCIFKCSMALSQTACNQRSIWQQDGACMWNPAASACETACPYRYPVCTSPCVMSTNEWGGICMPPSNTDGWMPLPTIVTPITTYALTYMQRFEEESKQSHNDFRRAILDVIGAPDWAADVVVAASHGDRFRHVIAFRPSAPQAAQWYKSGTNISFAIANLLKIRCTVEGIVLDCATPPPAATRVPTPAPNRLPAVTFWLLESLNASKLETATALKKKLAEVLKVPESDLSVVPTDPSNNTLTIAFLGPDAWTNMDKALKLTDAELSSLGAMKATEAEGVPVRPAAPVQSDAYIYVAAIVGALFAALIAAACVILLRRDEDDTKGGSDAEEGVLMAALAHKPAEEMPLASSSSSSAGRALRMGGVGEGRSSNGGNFAERPRGGDDDPDL